mgnify:CR=1 FL=1
MEYEWIWVESYKPKVKSGLHGRVHVRPIAGGRYSTNLHVECSKTFSDTEQYPLGTKFLIKAKLTNREMGGEFLYSSYRWAPREVRTPRKLD